MKNKLTILSLLLLILISESCKKEAVKQQNNTKSEILLRNEEVNEAQTKFAKILARAVEKDLALRIFLKEESIKQFDNDYDILYHMIKDKKVDKDETIHEKLIRYSSKEELDSIITAYPLLTIFIPKLPDFSPESWSAATEVPLVAAANQGQNGIKIYAASGEEMVIKANQIPSFPVLVVKQNERVIVNKSNSSHSNQSFSTKNSASSVIYQDGNLSFSYADQAFNGSTRNSVKRVNAVQNIAASYEVDPINFEAYNSGNEWHRDYIYYGITANNPNGKFRRNYSEFITSFTFLRGEALGIIADQDEDPRANFGYIEGTLNLEGNIPRTIWTEGNFEFKITVLNNAKNGIGTELTKIMSVKPTELFDLKHEMIKEQHFLGKWYKIYALRSVTPKEFNPNIELTPWDLESYGTAWKFIIYEVDNAQSVTKTFENTTTYATNFGIDGGIERETKKLGLKFGTSKTTVEKNTFSVTTTLDSDFLGEAVLTFDQPVITGFTNGIANTRKITTGNILSIGVEPRRVF